MIRRVQARAILSCGAAVLGFVIATVSGTGDRLLSGVAEVLLAEGLPIAGAVQMNRDGDDRRTCTMELQVLHGDRRICISQNLGAGSSGCRLDSVALEEAAGQVAAALALGPRLLILNKFGKAEAEGRGFRPLIGQALASGCAVLTAVNPRNLADFNSFADGMAEALPPDHDALLDWCRRVVVTA